MLSRAQIDQYRDQGAIVVPALVDQLTLRKMRQILADWVEGSRQVADHTDLYDLEPGHSAAIPLVRRIKKPHVANPLFDQLIRSEKMLAVMRDLIGPSLRLYGSKLNLKAPHVGSPVEWHQDWAFYPHSNDDILAVGVMLDDTTVANGAMYYIPDSHQGPTYNHHDIDGYFCGAIDIQACGLDVSNAVPCEGAAGSCSFHHVRAIHGSAQNTSPRSRGLLLYEVTAADAFPLMGVADHADFKSRLLCGQDTIEPRTTVCPIRMPLPPAKHQGSIYENQRLGKRYFDFTEPVVATINEEAS
jgi:phytanoyl-CoA hydroxylase